MGDDSRGSPRGVGRAASALILVGLVLINLTMVSLWSWRTFASSQGFADTTTDIAKKGKNVLWGWGEIARMTAGNVQFRDQFFEARYNLAFCRFKYALSLEEKDPNRKKLVNMAKLDVELTAKLFPDLGGDQWRQKFDVLLKNVQKEAGDLPKGLAGIQFDTSTEVKKGAN